MLVRLAFSVMIQVDADVLLIDEVLAVGDASFQQKCFEEFERIRASGKTVLFVTHDMAAVRRYCDRAVLIEHGRIVAGGDPEQVGNRYLELNFSEAARQAESVAIKPVDELSRREDEESGDGRATILDVWFEDDTGVRAEILEAGRDAAVAMRVRFQADVENPIFGMELVNTPGDTMLAASTRRDDPLPGRFQADEEVVVRATFPNHLGADRYRATVWVEREGHEVVARRERAASTVVATVHSSGARTELPYRFDVRRQAGVEA
jgi:ABC-type glutathione transport system ATPase component